MLYLEQAYEDGVISKEDVEKIHAKWLVTSYEDGSRKNPSECVQRQFFYRVLGEQEYSESDVVLYDVYAEAFPYLIGVVGVKDSAPTIEDVWVFAHYPGLVLLRLEGALVADLQLACTQVDHADENLLRRTSPGKKTVKPALDVLEVCIPATSNLPSLVSVSDVFRILLLAVLFRTRTEPEAIRDLSDQSRRLPSGIRLQVDGVKEFLVH